MAVDLNACRQAAEWFRQCLGPLPAGCALSPRVEGVERVGSWEAERIRYRAEEEEWVSALLVKPRGVARPPVVIAHHGHGIGNEDSLFGKLWPKARYPFEPEAGLTRFGVAVLAPDARCHGERLPDAPDPVAEPQRWREHFDAAWQWLARRCLIDGACLQALLVHDVKCAIDYLQTRDDLDASRLGMYGYSMGGTTCWSTAVVEPRIKVVAVGGCLLNYDTALRVRRDASWHAWVPGVRRGASREQLLASLAPRPLLAIHGEQDFPRQGVQPILDAAAEAYAQRGCPDHFRPVFLPGDHIAAACEPRLIEEAGQWFAKHL